MLKVGNLGWFVQQCHLVPLLWIIELKIPTVPLRRVPDPCLISFPPSTGALHQKRAARHATQQLGFRPDPWTSRAASSSAKQ